MSMLMAGLDYASPNAEVGDMLDYSVSPLYYIVALILGISTILGGG